MRFAVVGLGVALAVVGPAAAATPDVIRVAKPGFSRPLASVTPSGDLRLRLVSATKLAPTSSPSFPDDAYVVPAELQRERLSKVVRRPGTTLVVYGTGLIAGFGPRSAMKYAFDLRSFGFPPRTLVPRAYGPQEISWAHQLGRTLIVQTNHLGYAKESGNRNGYLTAIDIDTGNVRWRSPSLVANARNFVLIKGMIVSGYGFTAENDWLYLTDAKTGRVRDRVALPSMAERISVKRDRIVVRCYDARFVARLTPGR